MTLEVLGTTTSKAGWDEVGLAFAVVPLGLGVALFVYRRVHRELRLRNYDLSVSHDEAAGRTGEPVE